MTTTENTTHSSENTITRRKVLQSVAVVSAVPFMAPIVGAVPEARASDLSIPTQALLGLIDIHRHAWDAFGDVCEAADPGSHYYEGEVGKRRWQEATTAEEKALAAILLFPSQGPADDRAKGEYFRDMDACFEGYEPAVLDALLNAGAPLQAALADRQGVAEMAHLVQCHQAAIAQHDKLFHSHDWGLGATETEVIEALGPIRDALEALCAARPITSQAKALRREYLSSRLVADTDGCPALMQCMFDALLA